MCVNHQRLERIDCQLWAFPCPFLMKTMPLLTCSNTQRKCTEAPEISLLFEQSHAPSLSQKSQVILWEGGSFSVGFLLHRKMQFVETRLVAQTVAMRTLRSENCVTGVSPRQKHGRHIGCWMRRIPPFQKDHMAGVYRCYCARPHFRHRPPTDGDLNV